MTIAGFAPPQAVHFIAQPETTHPHLLGLYTLLDVLMRFS